VPFSCVVPICVQPAGGVTAVFVRVRTCAIMTLPLASVVGAVITREVVPFVPDCVAAEQPWRWDTAATITVEVLDLLIEAPDRSVLNLNVPALARDEIEDVCWARLAAFGSVRAAISEVQTDGALQIEPQATNERLPPDTDTALCAAGFATITTLVGIAEAWPPELGETAVAQRPVPGGTLEAIHAIPDAADSRTLRSRERG